MTKLNLGCCDTTFEGYLNVDITHPCDYLADLNEPWPWPDNSVAEIRAWDIFEHLRSPIHSMNESWRVLASGGILDLIIPTTDGRGWAQDPTHLCYPPWNQNSLFYYEQGNAHLTRFAPANGVRCAFKIESQRTDGRPNSVTKLYATLKAVKPPSK